MPEKPENIWYSINHKVKKYKWPCRSNRSRKITLYEDDVLTKFHDGTYTTHTGMCCFGIIIPEKDLTKHTRKVSLVLVS